MEQLMPFTTQELSTHAWQLPDSVWSTDDYWAPEVLRQDITTQRLLISTQKVKDEALLPHLAMETPLQRYKVACCLAAGASMVQEVLQQAVHKNLCNFVETLERFKPNPNDMHFERCVDRVYSMSDCKERPSIQWIPIFFAAQTKRMAALLKKINADYMQREGRESGTVVHYLCTYPPQNPKQAVKLLDYYLKKGVRVEARDVEGQTPLHRIAVNAAGNPAEVLLPLACMLLARGASRDALDNKFRTCEDILREGGYAHGPASFTKRLLLKQLFPSLERLQNFEKERDHRKECVHCKDSKPLQKGLLTRLIGTATATPRVQELTNVQSLMPMPTSSKFSLPRTRELDCKQLEKQPAFPFWQHFFNSDPNTISDKTRVRIVREVTAAFLNWEQLRTLVAMAVLANNGKLPFQWQGSYFANFALLENDYNFLHFLLTHKIPFTCNPCWASSSAMINLLQEHVLLKSQDRYGNTPFHYIACYGTHMLSIRDVMQNYINAGVDPFAPNRMGITPLELFIEHSYSFENFCRYIETILGMLMHKDGSDLIKENLHTGKSPLQLAEQTHKLWQQTSTRLVLNRLQDRVALNARTRN